MDRRTLASVMAASALTLGATAPAVAAPPAHESFVVVLDRGTTNVPAVAAELARGAGGRVGFVYEHSIQGFSLTASAAAAAALARNPRVAYVEPDMEVSVAAQGTPTGISRSFAAGNSAIDIDGQDDSRVDVDVAVIDTGVDWQHPDLDVVDGINCAAGSIFRTTCTGNGDDDHYHGTHVAGTVAAIDNGVGVVGVAPGARIHAVKVLNSQGSGYTSWIIAGIDWVAARSDIIEVANMSLGGSGYSQAQFDAIQRAVNKGVAFAVAAGNSDADANGFSPGGFSNVLSVSALADFNGLPGGGAASTCRADVDDTLANFSNWGSAVDIAAPGVCIRSTYPMERGEYGTISGTSMASPHVAGALALLASKGFTRSATGVTGLYNQVKGAGNLNWTDDSGDGVKERLLDVGDEAVFAPKFVGGGGGGGSDPNTAPTASFTSSCDGLTCFFTSTSSDADGSIASHAWTFGDGGTSATTNPTHTYSAGATYTVTLTVTDDRGATGTTSRSVSVTAPNGGVVLTPSSTSQGGTWTAVVTSNQSSLTGSWSIGGGSCSGNTCTRSGIPKRQGSVRFTASTGEEVVVTKP
ncbi:MAG: S8 family serine peptidase [Dermatophilaceae bacterium]